MSDERLSGFVADALRSGAKREDIKNILLDAKWSKDQVESALDVWSNVDFPVPVPRPRAQLSARDAALYLVMFAMLYWAVFNFGTLLFNYIELLFSDALNENHFRSRSRSIRFATSSLLVAFPVFMYLAIKINRNLQSDPSHRSSAIRKWLTYLTLSIAACVIVGDLIALINNLLMGELSVRFFLKFLVVGLTSAAVFYYYLWNMRQDDEALKR